MVGRFIVHRTLGTGGAGVVYAAHDPELDRTIALKILRRDLSDRGDARTRFLREAQALARLSHPNVISVYDVGSADGRAFIAMEYIHGHTFADWLATTERAWPEILAVLLRAGRGLAAAHAAGLIHRDFKPGNLLVGVDGRVVVTDFGLARAVAESATDDDLAEARGELGRSSAFSRSITRTGSVQGTPGYMAPEQQRGMPADARADQFSFCVTMYEALFRELPIRARPSPFSSTVAGAVEPAAAQEPQALEGVPRVPRDVRGVPVWLQRAVQRGLSWRPEDRHPSMESLLGALSREPARRRRLVMLALAVTVAVVFGGGVVAFATVGSSQEETCNGAREQVSRKWNRAVAARVRAAFAASDRPHAQSSAGRVAEQLDAYTGQWADMHRSACLATSRGEQSPELLDRRMVCLGRRLDQTAALLDLFVRRADGALVDRALDLVGGLEPLSTCADSAALLARVAPPADPARRARVIRLERQADYADLEWRAGRPQQAVDEARAVLEAGRPLDYPPLAARAGRVLGMSLEDLGRPAEAREALIGAQRQAEAAGDVTLAAHLMLDLLIVINVREKRVGEAQLVAQLIEAVLERPDLRRNEVLRARLLAALGSMANDKGQADRAIELQREALAIRRRIDPPISNEVANAEQSLGNALLRKALYDEARTHYFKTLAIRRQVFGDQHPLVANVHVNLGVSYIEGDGNAADARKHFLAALAILEREPSYRSYPTLLTNMAELEHTVGNLDQALIYHETALAAYQRQFGPDHEDVAVSLQNIGTVRRQMGAFGEALALHRRALALYKKTAGADHPDYAVTLSELGEDLRRLGRAAEALRHQERALQILRARMGQHPKIGYQLAYKGLALVDLRRGRQAVPALEQALKTIPPGNVNRAQAAFALARALEPRRPRSARARALAREALAIFTAVRASRERDAVAGYLAHGPRSATQRR